MTEGTPEFTNYVSGKGPGTNRHQLMQVLGWVTDRHYTTGGSISTEEVMQRLNASKEFVHALFVDMINEDLIRITSVRSAKYEMKPPPLAEKLKIHFMPESG